MLNLELTLRARSSPPLEPEAWYLPGKDVAFWLDEIVSWPIDHERLRMIVIRGEQESSIDGAVILPSGEALTPSERCIGLGRMADNFYLPTTAELFPPVTQEELVELLSPEYVYVWLPGSGLTAAEPDDVLGVADLIELPREQLADWNQAAVGIAFPNRLTAVRLETPPTLEDFLQESRDDIGDQSSDLEKLPKTPDEPKSELLAKAKRLAMLGGAAPMVQLASWMKAIGIAIKRSSTREGTQALPNSTPARGGASGASSQRGFAHFADQLKEKLARSLEAERHREINRLLHLLESDPDQGLKFALPFGGQGRAHRGVSTPGHRLDQRTPDFDLQQLGGGGPADFWDMSPKYQAELIKKYRELASRETRLGRYRRAAYIYAHLLGDYRSAASALEQGRQYREAAVLYRDKLNDSLGHAKCLERGELWNEAIDAYRELGRHEKVGDLLTFIEQHDEAATAFRMAADELFERGDYLGAARIYEEKIGDQRQAIATLDAGWPYSPQSKRCVLVTFAIRGKMGWHEESKARIEELTHDANSLGRVADIAELIADVYETYPATDVQIEARKAARTLAANRMRELARDETARVVAVLSRLDPTDRLLRRDGARFLDQRRSSAPPSPVLRSRQRRLQPGKTFDLRLPNVTDAVKMGPFVIAVGQEPQLVTFACADLSRESNPVITPHEHRHLPGDGPILLFAERNALNVFPIGRPSIPDPILFPSIRIDSEPLQAATPHGLNRIWGAAIGRSGNIWAIANRDDPTLVCVNSQGDVISTRSLLGFESLSWEDLELPIPMHVAGKHLMIGVGRSLLTINSNQTEEVQKLPERIIRLTGRNPYAAPIVVASMEVGVAIIRMGFESSIETFADDLEKPIVLLTSEGLFCAADDHKIVAHAPGRTGATGRQERWYAETSHHAGPIAAILAGASAYEFLLVSRSGRITCFSVVS